MAEFELLPTLPRTVVAISGNVKSSSSSCPRHELAGIIFVFLHKKSYVAKKSAKIGAK